MKNSIKTAIQTVRHTSFMLVWGLFALIVLLPNIALGQQFSDSGFPYEIQWTDYVSTEDAPTNLATELIKPDTNESTSLLSRLTDLFRLSETPYNPSNTTTPATNYVKWILNILLGLVSLLSLVMIVFAFYLIFFSKGEEAVGKAKKILVGVAIALAIMGLSRFIASFFFNIYTTVTV